MIRYQLVCERGDRFEAWFRSSDDFARQHEAGDIACPLCGTGGVDKALTAPAVRSSKRTKTGTSEGETTLPATPDPGGTEASQQGAASAPMAVAGGTDPSVAKAIDLMSSIARHVRDNSDNVGRAFAEEARKIHYKEAPARSIVGEATVREARELAEEGIEFQPLPILPEDRN